jgi:hypothetical protein
MRPLDQSSEYMIENIENAMKNLKILLKRREKEDDQYSDSSKNSHDSEEIPGFLGSIDTD